MQADRRCPPLHCTASREVNLERIVELISSTTALERPPFTQLSKEDHDWKYCQFHFSPSVDMLRRVGCECMDYCSCCCSSQSGQESPGWAAGMSSHGRSTIMLKAQAACFFSVLWFFGSSLAAQNQGANDSEKSSAPVRKGIDYLTNYLNMAGAEKATDFRPLTQNERTRIYLKTMVNPLGFAKAAFSAGIDQWNDKPTEWQQGMAGYGQRFANIVGQYSIQRTATFGLSSLLHEDNRYFGSGKSGFWSRTGYALASSVLARHDDGHQHFSISQVSGVAAGAFVSRLWQPPSQNSARDGAVSFAITMASNTGFSVVKEFLPDLGRAIRKKRKNSSKANCASLAGPCGSLN